MAGPHAGKEEEMPTVNYCVASYNNLTPALPLAENPFLLTFPLDSMAADRAAAVYNAGDGAVFLLTSVSDVGLRTHSKNRNRSTSSLTIKIESKIDRSLKTRNRRSTNSYDTTANPKPGKRRQQ